MYLQRQHGSETRQAGGIIDVRCIEFVQLSLRQSILQNDVQIGAVGGQIMLHTRRESGIVLDKAAFEKMKGKRIAHSYCSIYVLILGKPSALAKCLLFLSHPG